MGVIFNWSVSSCCMHYLCIQQCALENFSTQHRNSSSCVVILLLFVNHWDTVLSFVLFLILRQDLTNLLRLSLSWWGGPWTCYPPTSASQITGMTGMFHQTWILIIIFESFEYHSRLWILSHGHLDFLWLNFKIVTFPTFLSHCSL